MEYTNVPITDFKDAKEKFLKNSKCNTMYIQG